MQTGRDYSLNLQLNVILGLGAPGIEALHRIRCQLMLA